MLEWQCQRDGCAPSRSAADIKPTTYVFRSFAESFEAEASSLFESRHFKSGAIVRRLRTVSPSPPSAMSINTSASGAYLLMLVSDS